MTKIIKIVINPVYICIVKKTIFLLALLMLLKPVLPVMEYAVNYEYISKVLCVNKAEPKLKCNGKCHLMKELAKASDTEKPISSDRKIAALEFEVLFLEELKSFKITSIYLIKKEKINSIYSNLYAHLNSASVFHPPTFIS